MEVVNQNNAIASQEMALVPGLSMIDGRTEIERLNFLTNFGLVINFYDQNNLINGNWAPFLLKDPVLLVASISKTNFLKIHTEYLNTCKILEKMLSKGQRPEPVANLYKMDVWFNRLFNQITELFMRIERWTYYMQMTSDNYSLKKYTLAQVTDNLSQYFWAVLALREFLSISSLLGNIDPVKYYLFEGYDELIWKQGMGKIPFQEFFGITNPLANHTNYTNEQNEQSKITNESRTELALQCFESLKNTGDFVFRFFNTVIQHSTTQYAALTKKKSHYPDTVLLRTFVNLLQVQQAQLNEISQKHLQFYYEDILKQNLLPATVDNVFIYVTLLKQDSEVNLPAGTLFNAGLDVLKNPIMFETLQNVTLNPATIVSISTLASIYQNNNSINNIANESTRLYLQNIANPGVITKDELGNVETWETLGGKTTQDGSFANTVSLGFAFASPMLYLMEGDRKITITFTFNQQGKTLDTFEQSLKSLLSTQNATYYLSTQKVWLDVSNYVSFMDAKTIEGPQIKFRIILPPSVGAIEAFAQKMDGVDSSWPMLKIMFTSLFNLTSPPIIKSIDINVHVSGAKTFQLYNDYGLLSTKTPFQLFGPIPDINSNFIIGSNELFSKKLDALIICLEWDNLPVPADFLGYYKAYNDYLTAYSPASQNNTTNKQIASNKNVTIPPVAKKNIFKKIGEKLISLFKRAPIVSNQSRGTGIGEYVNSLASENVIVFDNTKFKVQFSLLQGRQWDPYTNERAATATSDCLFYTTNTSVSKKRCWIFSPSSYSVDPTIQNMPAPFTFTDSSTSGFLKMTLTNPEYGFGSAIYAGVVSWIALQNAQLIAISGNPNYKPLPPPPSPPTKILASPNLPFAPKVKSFIASYSASQSYDLTGNTTNYPLQCFYYSPFANYTVYDNSVNPLFSNSSIVGVCSVKNNIQLFPAFPCNGALFIELENLLFPDIISLLFELAVNYTNIPSANKLSYYYLSDSGWKDLSVIQDGTNNFSCSGIISLDIPGDITNQSPTMPYSSGYWIAITGSGDLSCVSQTVLVNPNGIELRRSGNSYLTDTVAPVIASGTITKPQTAIPQIASVTQSYPSFGGKATETKTQMNQRVSNRIKTKDRTIGSSDFFTLIHLEFPNIYYSKALYNADTGTTEIFVIEGFASPTDANAFSPAVSNCEINEIQNFLKRRVSLFSNIRVSNFKFQYVKVTATILIKSGFGSRSMQNNISQALDVFFSPWIVNVTSSQVIIDEVISQSQVAHFIKTLDGVISVSEVILSSSFSIFPPTGVVISNPIVSMQQITPARGALFVSSMNHVINIQSQE